MAADATLVADKRTDTGKNQARRHRAAGRLPAVVYGPGTGGTNETSIPVTVDPKALSRILHSESGANTIISLQIDGGAVPVLVKDFLLHPVSHALLHADFYRVAMDRKLTVTVPRFRCAPWASNQPSAATRSTERVVPWVPPSAAYHPTRPTAHSAARTIAGAATPAIAADRASGRRSVGWATATCA